MTDGSSAVTEAPTNSWPFEADDGDHFETSQAAYEDILPLLRFAARQRAKRRGKETADAQAQLRIYDPYFCTGRAKLLLNELGFPRVTNRRRDFYSDIAEGGLPRFDVLMTNPPYSEDHKERLYNFLVERQRVALANGVPEPFLLLLPSWTTDKVFHKRFLRALVELNSVGTPPATDDWHASGVFYVCGRGQSGRPAKYTFDHVRGIGLPQAPFFGVWICGGFGDPSTTLKAMRRIAQADGLEALCADDASWYSCRPLCRAEDTSGGICTWQNGLVVPVNASCDTSSVDIQWSDGSNASAPAESLRGGRCVFGSLSALESAGLIRSTEDVRRRRETNTKQKLLHQTAMEQVKKRRLEAREADGGKRRRGQDKRVFTSAVAKSAAKSAVVEVPEGVCTHFFLSSKKGCTRGAKCRFKHVLPE